MKNYRPKNKIEYSLTLQSKVFNNNQTQALFMNLPIDTIINYLGGAGIEIEWQSNKNSSNEQKLLEKRSLMFSIKEHVTKNHANFNYMIELAGDIIAANPGDSQKINDELIESYQVLIDYGVFTNTLEIQTDKFNDPMLSFMRENIKDAPADTKDLMAFLGHMARDHKESLILGNLIIKYREQSQTSFLDGHESNKRQTKDHGMDIDNSFKSTTVGKAKSVDSVNMKMDSSSNLMNVKSGEATSMEVDNTSNKSMSITSTNEKNVNVNQTNKRPQTKLMDVFSSTSSGTESTKFSLRTPPQSNNNHQMNNIFSSSVPTRQFTAENNVDDDDDDDDDETSTMCRTTQNINAIKAEMSKKQRIEFEKLFTTRRGVNGKLILTLELKDYHYFTYKALLRRITNKGPEINAAFKIQISQAQIPALLVAEQEWLYKNDTTEETIVNNIIDQIRNGNCNLLRKKYGVNTEVSQCFSQSVLMSNVLITSIPKGVPNLGVLVREVLTKAGHASAIEQSEDLQVNCLPIGDTGMKNGKSDSDSIQSLYLRLLIPIQTTELCLYVTTTSKYQVATTPQGKPVLSTVTLAINYFSEEVEREQIRNSKTIGAIRGIDALEAQLLAPYVQRSLTDTLHEGLFIIAVPVHSIHKLVKNGIPVQVAVITSFYLIKGPQTLTIEEIDNILIGLGIPDPHSNNIIRVQCKNLEIRPKISGYHEVGMPKSVFDSPTYMVIKGCKGSTPEEVLSAIPSEECRDCIAYIRIIPMPASGRKQDGTHWIFIVWKGSNTGNPDLPWFRDFKNLEGKLSASHETFGYPSQEPTKGPGSKGYNYFHLSTDLVDQKVHWASSPGFVPVSMSDIPTDGYTKSLSKSKNRKNKNT